MTELKNRIQSAMDYAQINGKELSILTGLTTAAISQYKTGKILTLNAMAAQKIADALGVNVEWLVTGEGNMIKPNIISLDNADSDKLPAGFVQIPEYKICFGAGEAEEPTYEEIQDCVPAYFRSSFFSDRGINPKNCKRFKVIGDSMIPLINDGDYITVDCTPKDYIENNQIYALVFDHSLRIKRLIKSFKTLTIRSDNQIYPDEVLTLEEAAQMIHIIGKVIERSGSV
jgi:phage repressor protein C with HTH and peptisase S24 domain|nr:MAG TPA: Repressor protein CI [Caudoviricetes sp.]